MSGKIFRPRARIMKTLGEELISSDSVALLELVKNSYDADASEVLIKFEGPLESGKGSILVVDNGKGMSRAVVEGAWMEPATVSKVENKKSTKKGRRVLGEKGIGRFAAARLSSVLRLASREVGGKVEVNAVFDWRQFEDEKKFLDEVEIQISESLPVKTRAKSTIDLISRNRHFGSKLPHGTILDMVGLKQNWNNKIFDEIQRGLSRLVSPFESLSDFRIKIEAPAGFEQYSQEISPPEVIKYPHYTVKGWVHESGEYSLVFSSIAENANTTSAGFLVWHPKDGWIMRDGLSASDLPDKYSPPESGRIELNLRFWDRDELGNVVQKTGGSISSVRKDLDSFAGVNIYRDGFRVMPYGEPNNDWLRLDMRRVQKPTYRLSNNQIVGYISITADGNPNLKDQSNREGLRENQAYSDLSEIMLCILSKMEDIRYKARKGSTKSGAAGANSQGGLFDPIDFSQIRAHMSREIPNDAIMQSMVDGIELDYSKRIESFKTVVSRYSGLATLGKLVDAVLHESRQPLAIISGQAGLGQEDLEDFGLDGNAGLIKAHDKFAKIKNQSGSLSSILKRIEPFGGRKSGRPPQLYLEEIVAEAFAVMDYSLKESGIKYSISKGQTLVRVDGSEVQQILINLIDNSIYWLQFVAKGARKIQVSIARMKDEAVELVFSDSGPGVPEEHQDHIFDAYYSQRKEGAGLGLSIIGEMISSYYGGSLELLGSGELPGANFRLVFRRRV